MTDDSRPDLPADDIELNTATEDAGGQDLAAENAALREQLGPDLQLPEPV